jgi:hypothetical protein
MQICKSNNLPLYNVHNPVHHPVHNTVNTQHRCQSHTHTQTVGATAVLPLGNTFLYTKLQIIIKLFINLSAEYGNKNKFSRQ